MKVCGAHGNPKPCSECHSEADRAIIGIQEDQKMSDEYRVPYVEADVVEATYSDAYHDGYDQAIKEIVLALFDSRRFNEWQEAAGQPPPVVVLGGRATQPTVSQMWREHVANYIKAVHDGA